MPSWPARMTSGSSPGVFWLPPPYPEPEEKKLFKV
jgi:hypothetical protein